MAKITRTRKYFTPQREHNGCRCDFPGCKNAGEYRAPKDRSLKEYYWFCLEHVQSYNARWNYYNDEFTDEEEENLKTDSRSRMRFKSFRSKINYQFGYKLKDDFEFFGQYAQNFSSRYDMYFTEKEKEFLKIMELSGEDLSLEQLKKQYKKLVKKYHPDLHRDDKDAEEKFKQLTNADQALCAKLS